MPGPDFIAFVVKHWKAIVGGLSLAILGLMLVMARSDARHWRKRFDQEAALHKADLATVEAAAEKARADDLKHAALIKARDDATAKEMNDALSLRLADARRAADAYAARLRGATAANQGSAGGTYLSPAANSTGGANGSGESTELVDARICAENTVKAQTWLAWWQKVSAAPR